MQAFRYDAHPMGMFISTVAALSSVLPGGRPGGRRRQPPLSDHALDRQGPDDRRVLLPAQPRPALRLPQQQPELPRQFPEHDVQDVGAASIRSIRRWSRRSTSCSSCTPTTSRIAARTPCGPSARAGSTRTAPWPGRRRPSTGRCTAAPTRPCCACWPRSATCATCPAFIERVKAGDGRLMGFGHRVYKNYDPRARLIKRVADQVFEVTGRNPADRHRPRVGADRPAGRLLRLTQAVSERRFLLGDHLPGDGYPGRPVPGALRHSPHRRLAGAVAGDDHRPRAEDRPAAADLVGRTRRSYVPIDRRDYAPAPEPRAVSAPSKP